jgi:hypothetical protein
MLKLLTILSNILVTNLQALDSLKTEIFVESLIAQLKLTKGGDISLKNVDSLVPELNEKATSEQVALTLGFQLLKELAFKFITYVSDEVTPTVLKGLLLDEFTLILHSLVKSQSLSAKLEISADPGVFSEFFNYKVKKMNFKMMLLADCIAPNEASPELKSIYGYIDALSQICEVKATAYHDVTS